MDIKRAFDIVFSLFAVVVAAPLFLLCVLGVLCSSKGPIFYGCTRLGKGKKPFTCWKFRTMIVGAESSLERILARDPSLLEEWQTFYKLKKDPRVTKIGNWLRKTSLDELPQFWNILKGEMSVVGPRPLSESEACRYVKKGKIFSVPPGLTSIWTISGRSDIPYPERLCLEEKYVDERSLWLDVILIGKTVRFVLFAKGAY